MSITGCNKFDFTVFGMEMKGMCFAEMSGRYSLFVPMRLVDLLWSFLTLPGSECGECCTVHASVQLREEHYTSWTIQIHIQNINYETRNLHNRATHRLSINILQPSIGLTIAFFQTHSHFSVFLSKFNALWIIIPHLLAVNLSLHFLFVKLHIKPLKSLSIYMNKLRAHTVAH